MATYAERWARANAVSCPAVSWAIIVGLSEEDVARVATLSDACAREAMDEARDAWTALSVVEAVTCAEVLERLATAHASDRKKLLCTGFRVSSVLVDLKDEQLLHATETTVVGNPAQAGSWITPRRKNSGPINSNMTIRCLN